MTHIRLRDWSRYLCENRVIIQKSESQPIHKRGETREGRERRSRKATVRQKKEINYYCLLVEKGYYSAQ